VNVKTEPRPLRADAERNRRRILDAARKVFAEEGLHAGVDSIARAAGVGVGTLYRRFPTKHELLAATIEDGATKIADEVAALHAVDDPWEAFAASLHAFAGAIARDRGFYEVIHGEPDLLPIAREKKQRLLAALDVLLRRAQDAGAVRRDIVIEDIPALCMVAARLPGWRLDAQPELWTRYLALLFDGLRPGGAQPLEHPPPLPLPDGMPVPRRRRAQV
jgi:AcrR family transcriptional regulator